MTFPDLGAYATDVVGDMFTHWMSGMFDAHGLGDGPDVPSLSQSPMAALQYMTNKKEILGEAMRQRPMVRLADGDLKIKAELTEEMSCEYEELAMDTGQAKFIVRYENWIIDHIVNQVRIEEDLHLIIDPVPTQRNWRTRWGGKIHTINIKRNEDGTSTVEMIALSMREHAKHLLIAANPFFAPEVQLPKMWMLPGPIRTVLFMTFFVNLARLFLPGLSFITNAFNPAAWLNPLDTDAFSNVNPLAWPIQVAFVDPLLDTSRWTVLGATWTDWHSSTIDMLKDSGCIMRFYTVIIDEDVDSPHQELSDIMSLVGVEPVMPLRNCIVASIEDFSGHEGPTGTPVDGLLDTIGVTLDDLVTSNFIDGGTGQSLDGESLYDVDGETPLFQTLLGVGAKPPKVVWREGQFSAITNSTHTLNKAPVKTVMTGGRSPTLVNETQTFLIKYGLSQLSELINVTIGTFLNTAWAMPGTPGLEELYQEQLSNTLFAWERFTDPVRALVTGDLGYNEWFERGSGTAYTLAGWLTLREARYKTRAFHAFQATVRNAHPWAIDRDIRLGERGGWEFGNIIYVDQVLANKRGWDRQKPVLATLSVGDDKDKADPFARGMRALQAVYSLMGAFFGEGLIFG